MTEIDIDDSFNSQLDLKDKFKPISLKVGFNSPDNDVSLAWDFRGIEAQQAHSSRHVLLADLESPDRVELTTILKYYYKLLPLGDFLKVVDLEDGQRRSAWQQKTSSSLDLCFLSKPRKGTTSRHIHGVLNDFSRFNDQFILVVVIFKISALPEDFVSKLASHMKKYNYSGGLTMFIGEQVKELPLELLPIPATYYNFSSEDTLRESLRNHMLLHASVRVRKVRLVVTCLSSNMELSNFPGQKWEQLDTNSIGRNHYYLDNLSLYSEHLQLKMSFRRKLRFSIQFGGELTSGDKFVMHRQFEVEALSNPTCEVETDVLDRRGREMSFEVYNSTTRPGLMYNWHNHTMVLLRESILEEDVEDDPDSPINSTKER